MEHANGPDPRRLLHIADRKARAVFFVLLAISLFGLLVIAAASTVLG